MCRQKTGRDAPPGPLRTGVGAPPPTSVAFHQNARAEQPAPVRMVPLGTSHNVITLSASCVADSQLLFTSGCAMLSQAPVVVTW